MIPTLLREIKKIDLIRDLNLDQNILHDLGFESEEVLINQLKEIKTKKEGYLIEDELVQFLLSNLDVNYSGTAPTAKNKSKFYI